MIDRRVGILGVGLIPFDRYEDVPVEALARRAVIMAMRDAGVERDDIQATFASSMNQGEVFGQRILKSLKFSRIPLVNVENACAGGSTALREAWLGIGTERFDLALVVGAEKMTGGLLDFVEADPEIALGSTAPTAYALAARRHMHEFGTPTEAFAAIAVKNRDHAALNPNARFREPFTLNDVLASRPVADPIRLLECCRSGSGAAALVVGSEKWCARRGGPNVWIEASGLASIMGDHGTGDITNFGGTRHAAKSAYEEAGIDPADLDIIELHDAFAQGELMHYEGLGLCAKGDGARLVADGDTRLGGRIPVNVSGGLLSKSHPVGATGVAQFAELCWQLRGEAEGRQVDGAHVALAHSQGGTVTEAGATCVTILSRG